MFVSDIVRSHHTFYIFFSASAISSKGHLKEFYGHIKFVPSLWPTIDEIGNLAGAM